MSAAVKNTFDPVRYSLQECEFLIANLGLPPAVAVRNIGVGVNPKAVLPAVSRIYELIELEKHAGLEWCGLAPIKATLQAYLQQADKWSLDRRRGRVRFPSMASYDAKGRPHMAGTGADGQFVRTYFDAEGQRVPFAIELVAEGQNEWKPDWTTSDEPKPDSGIYINHDLNRIECFCGHVEKFKAENRGSYNAARGRISRHLRSTNEEAERHREIHTLEFGS